MDSRKRFNEDYFESIYAPSNILTPEDYENSVKVFDADYDNFLPRSRDAKILDIGCGAGHFLYYLKKKGYSHYLGIDSSQSQINFCKKNITSNVELADVFDFLKNIENEFDAISMNGVLEHILKEYVMKLLEMIYKSLKSKGILLCRVPNLSNPFAIDSRYRDFTHECGFTEKSIYQVIYVAGFRGINIRAPQFHSRSLKSYLSKIMVRIFHAFLRKLFWHQGFTAPNILSNRLIVIAEK